MNSDNRAEALLNIEACRALLEIAVLGAELGDAQVMLQIADGVSQVRPDLPEPCAVSAMAYFRLDRRDDAERELETLLERFPDFQMGRALLGIYMKINGRSAWQHHFESVIDDGRDEFAVAMACDALGRPREQAVGGVEAAPRRDTDGSSGGCAVWA